MRIVCCGLLLAAVGVAPAAAQTSPSTNQPASSSQNTSTETRPALPTFFGDTGLWFVPTADTLPAHRASGQLFRANWDDRQGLTDVNEIGLTGAIGVSSRAGTLVPPHHIWYIPTPAIYGTTSANKPGTLLSSTNYPGK